MKKRVALRRAGMIAEAIQNGVSKLGRTTMKDLPICAILPLLKLSSDAKEGKDLDIATMNPHIFEILVFGSVATKGQRTVNDIDMMIIDSGFFSQFFISGCETEDWYEELMDNLEVLLNGWLDLSYEEIGGLLDTPVDLHILPAKMFKSAELRAEIVKRHKDPNFLRNAFSSMLRYNNSEKKFVPVDVAYFEERFSTNLSDLKEEQ